MAAPPAYSRQIGEDRLTEQIASNAVAFLDRP
jgi:hypothetical protein